MFLYNFRLFLILIIPNRQLTQLNDSQLTSATLPSCSVVTKIASSSSFLTIFNDFISQWLRNTITRTPLSSSTTTSRFLPIGKLLIRVNNKCVISAVLIIFWWNLVILLRLYSLMNSAFSFYILMVLVLLKPINFFKLSTLFRYYRPTSEGSSFHR